MNEQKTAKDKLLLAALYLSSAYISIYFINKGIGGLIGWAL